MKFPAFEAPGIPASVAAEVLIFVCGAFGFVAFFSDLAGGEQWWLRVLLVGANYLFVGLCVGALLPRLWPLAALAGWGPGLLGCLGLIVKLRYNNIQPYWSFLAVCLVAVPAFLLLAGYLGSLARRRISNQTKLS